jgi:hypothetical protein
MQFAIISTSAKVASKMLELSQDRKQYTEYGEVLTYNWEPIFPIFKRMIVL